jgi:EAL domain-containing protein (putative c-di-GMP-specific phosphodiesterase class I)
VPIGRQVLEEACREAVELQRRCPQDPPLTMSVNLSVRQLQRADIAADVQRALETSGLAPASLTLEVTESAMMRDIDAAVLRLEELHLLGVRLAIDDFGTGYSSLNYIRQFPFDILKVDRSFISDLDEAGEISDLTAAIMGLAGILHLQAVAEGIETAGQLERLQQLGCEFGQGYLFHRPMTKEDAELLAAGQARARSSTTTASTAR